MKTAQSEPLPSLTPCPIAPRQAGSGAVSSKGRVCQSPYRGLTKSGIGMYAGDMPTCIIEVANISAVQNVTVYFWPTFVFMDEVSTAPSI